LRAYSLFTLSAVGKITPQAERRLKVLQSLDTLGAGFQLASHDLDIRGAGNLLGEEQSGHIKEVGFELYQQMLEEAVTSLKAGITAPVADKWSPQITIGMPVMIPEHYVADLPVRLALYRRLAEIEDERDIEAFAAELVDRFGPLPEEVEHLLQIVAIKLLCRRANVEKIETGPKGAVVSFRDNTFADPDRLVAFIRDQGPAARVRPDMKVVFFDDWKDPEARLRGTSTILRNLGALAQPAKAAGRSWLLPPRAPAGGPYSAAGRLAYSVAARSIACARCSGVCAPCTAIRPPKMKQGTPSIPASLAALASRVTRSTSSSLARRARTRSASRPHAAAAAISTSRSVRSPPSVK